MQIVQSAIGFLRVIGWFVLVGALIFSAVYLFSGLGNVTDAYKGLYLLLAVSILLGGIFVWAVCITLAAITENSIVSRDILQHAGLRWLRERAHAELPLRYQIYDNHADPVVKPAYRDTRVTRHALSKIT
jgi:hypothetical protein